MNNKHRKTDKNFLNQIEGTLFLEEIGDTFSFEEYILSLDTFELPKKEVKIKKTINPRKSTYKPMLTRNIGVNKEGYCSICDKWFKLKTSNYWYHMNFKHGINSGGRKYPEPNIRLGESISEAFCNVCKKWICLGAQRKASGFRFTWFKHWQKMHK